MTFKRKFENSKNKIHFYSKYLRVKIVLLDLSDNTVNYNFTEIYSIFIYKIIIKILCSYQQHNR